MDSEKPVRAWPVLKYTVLSAGGASSGAGEMTHWPVLGVGLLVFAALSSYLLLHEVRTQGRRGFSSGSRWTGRMTAIALVLAGYAGATIAAAVVGYVPASERIAAAVVGPQYAGFLVYFVLLRQGSTPAAAR